MPLGEDCGRRPRATSSPSCGTPPGSPWRTARRSTLPLPGEPTDADRWILGRLREVREQVDALLEDFQFAKATEALYHFTWDELCDWYVELAKAQLRDESTAQGTRAVLGHVLDALLKLLHPIARSSPRSCGRR